MPSRILWIFLPIVIVLAPPNAARSADRHAGYYYPPITSEETFRARSPIMVNASREVRIGYIVAQTNGQHGRGFPPRYAMFAKGDDAEKMIIVGLDQHSFATLLRARGVLAQLTVEARTPVLFRNLAVEDLFTFFDLARMLGFARITISDGRNYAHRVDLR